MLQDIPYSELKRNRRRYEIMLLFDSGQCTPDAAAKKYRLSLSGVNRAYFLIRRKLMRLYVNHIAVVSGEDDTSNIMEIYDKVWWCYQDLNYVRAYFEKRYSDILTAYREGEPGVPAEYLKNLPPLRKDLSGQMIADLIEMREVRHMTYINIAKKLRLTPQRAKLEYHVFYVRKREEYLDILMDGVKNAGERRALCEYFRRYERMLFTGALTNKEICERIVKDYPFLA